MTKEQIREGQRIEEYYIEAWKDGAWKEISRGTTVGHKKLDRFPMVVSNRVRWTFDKFRATPMIQAVGLYSSLPPK
jgi:alpha-L-fucosidase